MTSSQEPPQPEHDDAPVEEPQEEPLLERPRRQDGRPERPRRQRQEPNPALDPRLVQLERRSRRPSRTGDVSLMVIGVVAFVFGVAMHYWVATSVLNSGGDTAETSNNVVATATPVSSGTVTTTATVSPQATATPLPDRTSCEEIRGTQYRSVSEREFFLANCTGGPPAAQPTQAPATQPTQVPATTPTQ